MLLTDKKEIRIRDESTIGFIHLIEETGRDPLDILKSIVENNTKTYISDLIIEYANEVNTNDPLVLAVMMNHSNSIILDAILRSASSIVLEAKEISDENLIITNREFLKRLNIDEEEQTLQDIFNTIIVIDKQNQSVLSEMDDDFQWYNTIGVKAWNALLNRKKYDAYMLFYLDGNDNIVTVDLSPSNSDVPVILDGYKESKKKVKDFVNKFRNLNKEA